MIPTEGHQGDHRPKQSQGHVALGVPFVTLGAEEGLGGFFRQQGHHPLDQFVKGADREAHASDQKGQPAGERMTSKRIRISLVTMAGTKPWLKWASLS